MLTVCVSQSPTTLRSRLTAEVWPKESQVDGTCPAISNGARKLICSGPAQSTELRMPLICDTDGTGTALGRYERPSSPKIKRWAEVSTTFRIAP